jgi:hypothetical protein
VFQGLVTFGLTRRPIALLLLASHDDQPHAPLCWVPIIIGGGGLLIFATICWVWRVLSHKN